MRRLPVLIFLLAEFFSPTLAFSEGASAQGRPYIKITEPKADQKVVKGAGFEIKWESSDIKQEYAVEFKIKDTEGVIAFLGGYGISEGRLKLYANQIAVKPGYHKIIAVLYDNAPGCHQGQGNCAMPPGGWGKLIGTFESEEFEIIESTGQ